MYKAYVKSQDHLANAMPKTKLDQAKADPSKFLEDYINMYYSQQQISMTKLKPELSTTYPPQSTGIDDNDQSLPNVGSVSTENPEKLSFPQVNSRPPIPAAEGHLYNRHRQDKNKSTDLMRDKSPPGEHNLKQIFEIYGQRIDGHARLTKSPNSMSAQNLRSSDGWS